MNPAQHGFNKKTASALEAKRSIELTRSLQNISATMEWYNSGKYEHSEVGRSHNTVNLALQKKPLARINSVGTSAIKERKTYRQVL